MSEWHEANKHEQFFKRQAEKHTGFKRWVALKLVKLMQTLKRWIAEEQEERRNWDD